jgi:hypothetical protein
MRVALRTNVELLQGWGEKERGMTRGAMMAAPAWELIRRFPRKAPRDNPSWDARFAIAGGRKYGGRMIAMKDSDVWRELGDFEDGLKVDYPPFAWGSGMRWREVGFREAKALGVIPEGWQPPPRRPVSSPNENLQMTPQVSEPALREALAERMRGMAEWDGDTLVFTDPNGTRPLPAGKITEIWEKGMPPEFHRDRDGRDDRGLVQRHALKLWVEDHRDFQRELDKDGYDTKPNPGRLDLFDDLWRLFRRLVPMEKGAPVYRGLAFASEKAAEEFAESVRKLGYAPLQGKPADSWSRALSGARKYAAKGDFRVMLVSESHRTAKDISPLVRSVAGEIRNPDPKHPLVTDGEVVFTKDARFRFLRMEKTNGGITIYVEER